MQITFNPLIKNVYQNKNARLQQPQNISKQNADVSFQALPNVVMIAKYRYPNQKQILAILETPKLPVEDIKYLVQESLSLSGLTKTSQVIDKACEILKGKEEVMLELAGFAFKKNNFEEASKILGFTAQNNSVNRIGIKSLKNLYYTPHSDKSSIYESILKSLDKFIGVHSTEKDAFDLLQSLFFMHGNEVAPIYKKVFLSSIEKAKNQDLVIKYVDDIGNPKIFVEHIEPLLLNKRTQKGALDIFPMHVYSTNYLYPGRPKLFSAYTGFLNRLALSKETADISFRLIKSSFASPKMVVEGLNIFRKFAQNPDLKDILFKHLELQPSEEAKLCTSLTYPSEGISNILISSFPEEKYTKPLFEKIKPMFESEVIEHRIGLYENLDRFLSCPETRDEAVKYLEKGFKDKQVDIRLSAIESVVKMLDDEKISKEANELLWDAIRIDYNMLLKNKGINLLRSSNEEIKDITKNIFKIVNDKAYRVPENNRHIRLLTKAYIAYRHALINAVTENKTNAAEALKDIGL